VDVELRAVPRALYDAAGQRAVRQRAAAVRAAIRERREARLRARDDDPLAVAVDELHLVDLEALVRLQLRLVLSEFFDNAADLYVVRTDFRFKEDWEGLIEVRLLEMPDLSDQRSGALIVVSRHLNSRFKVGLGYNFTDFSDDLTDLSFDHRGTFVSLTGAL
jgi:hypothetical protein